MKTVMMKPIKQTFYHVSRKHCIFYCEGMCVCVCVSKGPEVHSQFANAHSPLSSAQSFNGACLGLGLVYCTFKNNKPLAIFKNAVISS